MAKGNGRKGKNQKAQKGGNRGKRIRGKLHYWIDKWLRRKPLTWLAVVVVPVVGIALTWKWSSNDALRTEVYEPLRAEVAKLQSSIAASGDASPMTALASLRDTGRIKRVPPSLRERLDACYNRTNTAHSHLYPARITAQRVSIGIVQQSRSEQNDRQWLEQVLYRLNRDSRSAGTPEFTIPWTFNHTGMMPPLDLRNKQHPLYTDTGGLTWQMNDWIGFPKSAGEVERIWPADAWLCFNEQCTRWYERINKSDLQKAGTNLEQFLRPMWEVLNQDKAFRAYMIVQPDALACLNDVLTMVDERIGTPRRWGDIVESD